MLYKEMPFASSRDSYQAHYCTEHICPALLLPHSLQNKDTIYPLATNRKGRGGFLEAATTSCPQQYPCVLSQFPMPRTESSFNEASGFMSGFRSDPAGGYSKVVRKEETGFSKAYRVGVPLPLMLLTKRKTHPQFIS